MHPPAKAGTHHMEVTTGSKLWERIALFLFPGSRFMRRYAARQLMRHFQWPKDRPVPDGEFTFSLPHGGGAWIVTDASGGTKPFRSPES